MIDMRSPLLIIGLDPGLQKTGWGIIAQNGSHLAFVAAGIIKTDDSLGLPQRLASLDSGLCEVIAKHAPHEAAVEETFVNTNPASALKLGQARGVVMAAPARIGLPVASYAANLVKKSVVGSGHADKTQVKAMIKVLLPLSGVQTNDAADALAIAICHAHHRSFSQKLKQHEGAA